MLPKSPAPPGPWCEQAFAGVWYKGSPTSPGIARMEASPQTPREPRHRTLRDLAWVAAGTLLCACLAVRFEWSEHVFAWTRREESFQLDEITFVLLSLAIGLAWFAARRWREARRELQARLVVQARLAGLLAEQQRLGRQFVELQEGERKRLSRELHDELGQFINAIKLDAVAVRAALDQLPQGGAGAAHCVHSIIANTDLVHASVARLVRELRPVGLDELGLAAAIEHCVDTWRPRLAPTQLALQVDARIDGLDEARTLALYRTVQEALTNCARHSHADHISVDIGWQETAGPAAFVRIEDNGAGCDLQRRTGGLGLAGMRERLVALGGTLLIESAQGAGFKLFGQLPAGPGSEERRPRNAP